MIDPLLWKECKECLRMFLPTNEHQVFCTEQCSKRDQKRRYRQKHKGNVARSKVRKAFRRPPHPKQWHMESYWNDVLMQTECVVTNGDVRYVFMGRHKAMVACAILITTHGRVRALQREEQQIFQ